MTISELRRDFHDTLKNIKENEREQFQRQLGLILNYRTIVEHNQKCFIRRVSRKKKWWEIENGKSKMTVKK